MADGRDGAQPRRVRARRNQAQSGPGHALRAARDPERGGDNGRAPVRIPERVESHARPPEPTSGLSRWLF